MHERTRYMLLLTIEVIAMWITPKPIKEGGHNNEWTKSGGIHTNKQTQRMTYIQTN